MDTTAAQAVPAVFAEHVLPAQRRFDRLDALRGFAVLWMAAYHFCFDLNHLRLLQPRQSFTTDPFWTWQRGCIVTLFVFCSGLALAVALHQGQNWPRFWRRWAQVALCALLVSAGSALMFPKSWIVFGVLHGLAVMLVLARLLAVGLPGRPLWWGSLGVLALVLPLLLEHRFFDTPYTHWVGLVTRPPVTEDWVPLLPWLGVLLLGLASGHVWLRSRQPGLAQPLAGPLSPVLRPLAVLGRWSLSFYMLHQPVLLGVLMGGRQVGWW
jgi:uncharacterized membrane protein